MTDAWEPASQLEQKLSDALRDGDQDAYFALVSEAELFVPLPPGESDPSAFVWPTSTRDGRTHVLAYTSTEAAAACLGPTYQHFVRMTLSDMTRSWPDQEWWLAVNSGLPIEGYLPAWFIGQLTAGLATPQQLEAEGAAPPHDSVPPVRIPDAVLPLPIPDGPPPQNGVPIGFQHKGAHRAVPNGMPHDGVPHDPMGTGPNGMPPVAPHEEAPREGFPGPGHTGVPSGSPYDEAPREGFPGGGHNGVAPVPSPDGATVQDPAVFAPQSVAPFEEMPAASAHDGAPAHGMPPHEGPPPVPPHDGAGPAHDGGPVPVAPAHDGVPQVQHDLAVTAADLTVVPADDIMPPPVPVAPAEPPWHGVTGQTPVTLHVAEGAEFTPFDEEERTLHEAAARGDGAAFLNTLLSVRQIWVPRADDGDLMLGPGRPGFQWYTAESGGRRSVPLFTGPGRMREAMGGHPFVLSDLAKVLRFWPDDSWDLVVNGGTPIGVTIEGERVTELSRQVDDAAAARLASDFPAQSEAERQLFDARQDPDMLVKILLDTTVFLPVWSRTPPAVQTPPGDPAFPWSAVPVRGRPSVLAFTSFDWMKAAVGTTGFVMPSFAELVGNWPDPAWSISVNAGTPIEVTLSGEQIRALSGAAYGPAHTVPVRSQQGTLPRAAADLPPPPAAAPPVTDVAEGPAAQVGEQPQPAERVESLETPEGAWAIMQKVVPHGQVSWFLEQAYDRVAGFVHRVEDVIGLGMPARLYEALGLLGEGSPFTVDDAEVYVIRWPAYRAELYRIPFGGQAEEALSTWGDAGWMVEPPPFIGDGFAPGSAGSIREYKVESLRLPHGAEMYALGRDGSERFVARYDADHLVWRDAK